MLIEIIQVCFLSFFLIIRTTLVHTYDGVTKNNNINATFVEKPVGDDFNSTHFVPKGILFLLFFVFADLMGFIRDRLLH